MGFSPNKIKVQCIYSFQGEENKVIILSLTRFSNVGFTKVSNRVLVSPSHAKGLLIVLWNKNLNHSQHQNDSNLWFQIIENIRKLNEFTVSTDDSPGLVLSPCNQYSQNCAHKCCFLSSPNHILIYRLVFVSSNVWQSYQIANIVVFQSAIISVTIIILAKKKFKLLWISNTLCLFDVILLVLTKFFYAFIYVIMLFQIGITNEICPVIFSQILEVIIVTNKFRENVKIAKRFIHINAIQMTENVHLIINIHFPADINEI
jgi:hypothetical protein